VHPQCCVRSQAKLARPCLVSGTHTAVVLAMLLKTPHGDRVRRVLEELGKAKPGVTAVGSRVSRHRSVGLPARPGGMAGHGAGGGVIQLSLPAGCGAVPPCGPALP
jgi:hypothetical protein